MTVTPDTTPGPSEDDRRVSLVAVDDVPDLPVRPAVSVVEPRATADHPAEIRTSVTNVADTHVRLGEGRAALFAHQTDRDRSVVLRPLDRDWPGAYSVESGTWREQTGVALTMEHRVISLAPGESRHRSLAVYGSHRETGPLPTGTVHFESQYGVTQGEWPDAAGRETETATWGFDLQINR